MAYKCSLSWIYAIDVPTHILPQHEKPIFDVCGQQRRRPACASPQSDQCLCYSLIGKYHILTCCKQRGSSKSAHAWIWIMFCMLNTYGITTTKMKLFYSSNAVRPQGDTLKYTLFVLIYDLLDISLKSLTLLTATFFDWNIKEDFPGYTLLPLMYISTSR